MKKILTILLIISLAFIVGCKKETTDTKNKSITSSTKNNDNFTITLERDEYEFVERNIISDRQTYSGGDVVYPNTLWQTPAYEYASDLDFVEGVNGLFYTSPIKYNNKETKIAAYIGFPSDASSTNKVPAIVLVHGGLGTAVPDWVKYWNDLGFAAISMDTEGAEPKEGCSNFNNAHKERNRYENDDVYTCGPTNCGFSDVNKPLTEQWMYHATSSVILATSLISSFDCVDTQKIGMTGISWGSMIASIVVGYDDRISFCMPIYGGLSLAQSCGGFKTIYGSKIQEDRWDHLEALKRTNCKMFYVTSTADNYFSMDAENRCAKASNGFVLFKEGFSHGHEHAALEGNLPFFAKYFCGLESEFVEIIQSPTREDKTLKIRTYGDVNIISIKIHYTESELPDKSAIWDKKNVKLIDGNFSYNLNIPESNYAFVQIKYNTNLEVSSYLF